MIGNEVLLDIHPCQDFWGWIRQKTKLAKKGPKVFKIENFPFLPRMQEAVKIDQLVINSFFNIFEPWNFGLLA